MKEDKTMMKEDKMMMDWRTTWTKKPKRIIIYTTKNLLKLFAQGRNSSGDGTSKACPSLWKQIYIIMK